jgi:hypothetical protein
MIDDGLARAGDRALADDRAWRSICRSFRDHDPESYAD